MPTTDELRSGLRDGLRNRGLRCRGLCDGLRRRALDTGLPGLLRGRPRPRGLRSRRGCAGSDALGAYEAREVLVESL